MRHDLRRCCIGAVVAVLLLVSGLGTATAVPPPPPNPSDGQLQAGVADATRQAGEVGRLANRLAELDGQRAARQAEVELAMELANKAQIDLQTAQEQAAQAKHAAQQAGAEARAADRAVEDARRRLDEFASGSYQQGSTLGSMSAFLGARGPEELLARAHYLNAVGQSQLNALDGLERARTIRANKDSAARAALAEAAARQAAAEQAKRTADDAYAQAQRASQELAVAITVLDAERASAEQQLAQAQARVGGLRTQRQRYLDWQTARQREEQQRAQAVAGRPAAGGGVAAVIARALSQLGVPYAWGGGNANGPTRGIRDGGVADEFGDYGKVGFDCSGLMIFAFAGVGIRLPHYSGYQYDSGRRVPVSQARPGDMLFWSTGGRIHHVALYLGDAMMVEAPYSGSRVRVTAVRHAGLMPYAVRLL